MDIARSATAAFGDDCNLAGLGQIGQDTAGFGILDHGADGHWQTQILARMAGHIAPPTLLPIFSRIFALEPEILQGGLVFVGIENDTAAAATIATVRTAIGNILGCMERNHPIATIACAHIDFCAVDEHFATPVVQKGPCQLSWLDPLLAVS